MSGTNRWIVSVLIAAGLAAGMPVAGAGAATGAAGTITPAASTAPTAVPASTTDAGAAQPNTLNRTFTASLTPDEPGVIRVELQYRIPDGVTTLSTTLPEEAGVQSTDGFRRRSGTTYDWTQTTQVPSITYTLPVNRSVTRGSGGEATGGYLYVDAGPWAIARAPQAGVTYSGAGSQPELVTDYDFTRRGATSGDIIYVGRYEEHRATAAGQEFRLIVPAAAELQASPDAILGTLTGAAESLSIGPRDAEVVAIAAPTTVEWGSTGLQRGESDFWVLDDRGVATPSNVWIHEYVHTQQAYRTTNATEWSIEGFADYYAALLTYRQGRIDYDRFRRHLERGREFDDAVLAEPSTWRGTLAAYDKGALVAGALDRQLRLETDGSGTLQAVVRRFNGTVEQAELLAAVETVGGSDERDYAEQHTETDAVPATWSRSEHRAAFGSERPTFEYAFVPPYDRTGPYRTDEVGVSPTVVLGETLRLRVVVENIGGEAGEFEAVFRANGERVATRTGSLMPGDSTVLTADYRFETPEDVRVTVGEAAETVTVRPPAEVRVTSLEAPRRVAPGESVTLRATVGNPAGRPANGTVTIAVDGRQLTSELVQLPANGTATLNATTALDAGTHVVTAGHRERTIRVTTTTPRTATRAHTPTGAAPPLSPTENRPALGMTDTPSDVFGPGFGVLAALVALLAIAGALGARAA